VFQSAILGRFRPRFTGVGSTENANNLAILLRAGRAGRRPCMCLRSAPSAPNWAPIPSAAGRLSAIAGLVLVALFMILRYGLFGIFADIARRSIRLLLGGR